MPCVSERQRSFRSLLDLRQFRTLAKQARRLVSCRFVARQDRQESQLPLRLQIFDSRRSSSSSEFERFCPASVSTITDRHLALCSFNPSACTSPFEDFVDGDIASTFAHSTNSGIGSLPPTSSKLASPLDAPASLLDQVLRAPSLTINSSRSRSSISKNPCCAASVAAAETCA